MSIYVFIFNLIIINLFVSQFLFPASHLFTTSADEKRNNVKFTDFPKLFIFVDATRC